MASDEKIPHDDYWEYAKLQARQAAERALELDEAITLDAIDILEGRPSQPRKMSVSARVVLDAIDILEGR